MQLRVIRMCSINLESLELTENELRDARSMIREMAYDIWSNAGKPLNDGTECWIQAERKWIERCYVPHRRFEFEQADRAT